MDYTAIAALITAIAAITTALATRRKSGRESDKLMTEAATTLIRPLQERIEQQENRISELETETERQGNEIKALRQENRELRAGVELLCHQIVALGQEPVYRPRKVVTGE